MNTSTSTTPTHVSGMRRLTGRPEGRLVHLPDLYTEEERKTSAVYNEGWGRLVARNGLKVHFNDPDGLRLVWRLGDPVGGGCESAQLRHNERLAPHVRQYVRMRQALAAAVARGAGLAGLMNNERIGVVELDRGARVLATNAPALDILGLGDGLVERDGVLDARLPADRKHLRRLLARALPQLWGKPPSGGSTTLERPSGRARLALHVSPRWATLRRTSGGAGYGSTLFGDRFTGTPNLGFGLSGAGARDYRIGWRLTSAVRGDPGFEVTLDASRSEPANDNGTGVPEHGVMLRAGIRW